MLVIHVEIWPGGDSRRKRNIGTMTIANMTNLSDHSGYDAYIDGEKVNTKLIYHWREDGAWKLIQLVLNRYFKNAR